jgi:hypothetical protein
MPRLDYTDITIILDRSGSMESVAADTIGGFNRFLDDQKTGHGSATITLVQFDDRYETVYSVAPIATAPPLTGDTFVPRGSTALLDAIGRTIDTTGARLAAMREEDRPEQVMMVILTDGEENASRHFDNDAIARRISHQRDVYSWEFVFLGANQDAIATASQMGVAAGSALSYAPSPVGTNAAFDSVSRRVRDKRLRKAAMTEEFFEEHDRATQNEEIRKSKK